MTNKISRSQWNQIVKRGRQVNFKFDPRWKCIIDGLAFNRCIEHSVEDNELVLAEAKTRFEKLSA